MREEDVFRLVHWYQENKRDLPWRHTKDSYKIWISEIMLQQTRVEAVKEYYHRFLRELPTLEDLARVSDDKLMKLWEGLGYYSRARNLKACAKMLVDSGEKKLPETEEELLRLPGIGPYTVGAILSIAYLKAVPAIDGNVIRVLTRVLADEREVSPSLQKEYRVLLEKCFFSFPPDDFTEGFIELGALVCVPNGAPKCERCPLASCCKAHKMNRELDFPKKKVKKERKKILKTVFILKCSDKYSILKREDDLLKGMYEFPNLDQECDENEVAAILKKRNIEYEKIDSLGKAKHIFSHLEWHMTGYLVEVKKEIDPYTFATLEELTSFYSIPSAFQKFLQKIL